MATDLVRYSSYISNNERWERFDLRDDDIVITVPSKSGTTWMQTLVALLVFDGVPPGPISVLSPWLDGNLRPEDEVFQLLAAQEHRRFVKTHAPLDGLPQHPSVTYVTVGRDPRDAFMSMRDHARNSDEPALHAKRVAAVGDEDLADLTNPWPDPEDTRATIAAFIDLPASRSAADVNLANCLRHLRQAWDARNDDNKVLLHYADLATDLTGELRRLRDVLCIDIRDERIDELAVLASLDAMRQRATDTAPEADLGAWKDPAGFFRHGADRDAAAQFTEEELARYEQRCHDLHGDDPAFLHWVHHGSEA